MKSTALPFHLLHPNSPDVSVPPSNATRLAETSPIQRWNPKGACMTSTPSRIVSIDWLATHRDDPNVVVVDVRPEHHYRAGHISGARNVDIHPMKILDSDPAAIDRWVNAMQSVFRGLGITLDDHVVFYENISGTSAARGVWLMEALSIGHGSMLDGGLAAWHAAGHDLSTEPVDVAPSDLIVALNRNVFATAPDILSDLENATGARIVDTRNQVEWIQGTIPTSTHLEWSVHLDATGRFKPMEELRALYEALDLSPDKEICTFCASGYRAAHTWLVLTELGYENVRNYAPSWGEWHRRNDVPIERPR